MSISYQPKLKLFFLNKAIKKIKIFNNAKQPKNADIIMTDKVISMNDVNTKYWLLKIFELMKIY